MAVINILKGLIGKEDINLGKGVFSRLKSDGSSQTLNKLALEHLHQGHYKIDDYGAVGDGVADDTEAFKDAIAVINANGGGVLELGAKTYAVSEGITIGTRTLVSGTSMQSRIKALGTMDWVVRMQNPGARGFRGGLLNFTIDCDDLANYAVYQDSWFAPTYFGMQFIDQLKYAIFFTSDQEQDIAGGNYIACSSFAENIFPLDASETFNAQGFFITQHGATGRMTDSYFYGCSITGLSDRDGTQQSIAYHVIGGTRVTLRNCRCSNSRGQTAFAKLTDSSTVKGGSGNSSTNSGGHNIVDCYQEQNNVGAQDTIAVGV